jgi:hypothetical protein
MRPEDDPRGNNKKKSQTAWVKVEKEKKEIKGQFWKSEEKSKKLGLGPINLDTQDPTSN